MSAVGGEHPVRLGTLGSYSRGGETMKFIVYRIVRTGTGPTVWVFTDTGRYVDLFARAGSFSSVTLFGSEYTILEY